MTWTIRLTAVALLLLSAPAAWAQGRARLEISGADFRPLPLAVAPFQGAAEHVKPVSDTLNQDLEVSGLFQLLNPRSFLADPKTEGMTASSIDFTRWSAVGADSLVKAAVTGDGDKVKVEFRLFAVQGGKEALRATYEGKPGELRGFAHRFADEIVQHFTGEPGVFRTRLAFIVRKDGGKQLWTSDWDGTNPVALTKGDELNLLPAWSPNGASIALTSYRSGFPMLHVIDVASKSMKILAAKGDLQTGADWSPDGKRIAFTMSQQGTSNLWVMNSDGTNLTQLTDTRAVDSSPSWSPDGRQIAFVSTRSGDPQLFLMNADGSGVQRLTFQGRYNQTPEWSPRGDSIAFTARDERNVFDLFVIDLPSRKIRRLTQDQGNNEEPSYSPNGRHIVFSSTRSGSRRLWIMNSDGTNQRRLALDVEASTPAWGPFPE